MRAALRVGALVAGVAFGATAASAAGWDVTCGQEGKPPCTINAAKFEFKQSGLCPSGQFFDLIQGGTCWTCPAGYGRTVFAVDTDKACEKVATQDFRRANENGKGRGFFGTDCAGGQFWDIVDGNCHSCPSGYAMQVVEHVHGARKCARSIPGSWSRATRIGVPCGEGKLWDPRNGGECWSCPNGFLRTMGAVDAGNACSYSSLFGCRAGLSNIRGTCVKTGVCGKAGQRPCEITERVPSCDEGLKEDFKQNRCVALVPGETPFTGGLSSLAGYWGATLQAHCKELLGGIRIDFEGDFGVGVRCGKDIAAGFACGLARDVAAGETDLVNSLLETPVGVASLAEQMNAASQRSPCKELAERFAKATRHAQATGAVVKMDCPAGQFWDPDGWCYSCPKDYTRTAFPVTDARACTDRVGGNLQRFGCGAFKGVEINFDAPLDCTVQVLQDGSIFEQQLDLAKANQEICMATGELGYYIVRSGLEIGKAAATGDISGILTSIGKVKSSAMHAMEVKRLLDCSKKKA